MLLSKHCNAYDSVNRVNNVLAVYSAVLPPSLMVFLVLKIPFRLHVSPLCYLSN